jgi:uncharacterized membrane protein
MMFRRRADDLLVATLEAGGIGLTACYVALEIRYSFGDGRLTGPISFSESAWQLLTLTVQAVALLHIAGRTGRPVLHWAWRIAGGMALACGMALLVINPALTNADAGIASLAAAYAAPAALAMLARRQMPTADLRDGLTLYAVVSGFAWMTLQIREAFHPGAIGLYRAPVADAELWAWSGAWLAYGVALMMQGIRAGDRLLRMFAMAVVGLVCAKVFLVDMSDLAGLWRVLSFLGLGLALIGLGAVYRRFVLPTKQA